MTKFTKPIEIQKILIVYTFLTRYCSNDYDYTDHMYNTKYLFAITAKRIIFQLIKIISNIKEQRFEVPAETFFLDICMFTKLCL